MVQSINFAVLSHYVIGLQKTTVLQQNYIATAPTLNVTMVFEFI